MAKRSSRFHPQSDRYMFDGHPAVKDWIQYDTKQDASYYGVWYHPGKRQVVSFCEGGIDLVTASSWEDFVAYMQSMDTFHGAPPPYAITGDDFDINGHLTNVTAYVDPLARLDYNKPAPPAEEQVDINFVYIVFAGAFMEELTREGKEVKCSPT